MTDFKEMGLRQELLQAIAEQGYEHPMPVQEQVIPWLLKDPSQPPLKGEESIQEQEDVSLQARDGSMDLVALAQTGTGKTAAYGLPLLQKTLPLPSLVGREQNGNPLESGNVTAPSLQGRAGGGSDAGSESPWGWVGDVDRADGQRLASLINEGIVPVIAPLTHDGQGHLLNTNADTMAQTVACALAPYYKVSLRYAFEKRGVMRNPDDPATLIPHIAEADFRQLCADGIIQGGMIPKVENALQAIRQGVSEVLIGETKIS